MSSVVQPPGWPTDLPPPMAEEFAARVGGWLLDRGPQGLRDHGVWRRQPRALGLVVRIHVEQELAGLRQAYSLARAALAESLGPDEMAEVLVGLEAAGSSAAETVRQVGLVLEALEGRQWRARL